MTSKRVLIAASVMLGAVLLLPAAALAASARQTVAAQVNEVVATLAEPAFKDQQREAKISKIRSIVNGIFDYRELSRRALGRKWHSFNPKQQGEFVQLFSELLEKTYADRLLSYSGEKVVFEKETELRKDQVEVASSILTGDGKRIPINYRLIRKSDGWRVYDVVIEGISLVKNYREQFRDILAKDSPEDVLKILRDKVSPG